MKSSSLFSLVVLLALATLAPWVVEGFRNDAFKAGACPSRKPAQCLRYEKPECKDDWQCPGKKRCCQGYCGIKCLDPVAVSKPVLKKPGKCPKIDAECLMLNPPNNCQRDSQCDRNYKCCKGICGKVCMPPV
ncbi:antileukoproteinase [Nannospalax galili]|uniref:Secretory leukocyte peptidase inhibitor n=1 Tax=Nannospalax galili TaxID=1026970 RepID=A0A8C6QL03_NANGA|nr:antileukoproteinase [Nannospalax galili]